MPPKKKQKKMLPNLMEKYQNNHPQSPKKKLQVELLVAFLLISFDDSIEILIGKALVLCLGYEPGAIGW